MEATVIDSHSRSGHAACLTTSPDPRSREPSRPDLDLCYHLSPRQLLGLRFRRSIERNLRRWSSPQATVSDTPLLASLERKSGISGRIGRAWLSLLCSRGVLLSHCSCRRVDWWGCSSGFDPLAWFNRTAD
ncbi:hypothetical protein AKJ16_DCAP21889 [Drosera capensis]